MKDASKEGTDQFAHRFRSSLLSRSWERYPWCKARDPLGIESSSHGTRRLPREGGRKTPSVKGTRDERSYDATHVFRPWSSRLGFGNVISSLRGQLGKSEDSLDCKERGRIVSEAIKRETQQEDSPDTMFVSTSLADLTTQFKEPVTDTLYDIMSPTRPASTSWEVTRAKTETRAAASMMREPERRENEGQVSDEREYW